MPGTISYVSQITCDAIPCHECWEPATVSDWHSLLVQNPKAPVFFHPEWIRLACATGADTLWRLLIVRQGDTPIGIMPIRKRTRWTAEPLAPTCPGYPALVIAPSAREAFWHGIALWLCNQSEIGLLSCGRCGDLDNIEQSREAIHAAGGAALVKPVMPEMRIKLPESWETYLAGLGKPTRRAIRQSERILEDSMPDASVRFLSDADTCQQALEGFFELHRIRWRHQPSGSIFDDERTVNFYRSAILWAVRQGYATIVVFQSPQALFSVMTLLHIPGQDTVCCHLIARNLEASVPKNLRTGTLLFAHTIQWAIERKIRFISLAHGGAEYKEQLGAEGCEQCELFLARSPLAARVCSRLDPAIHHARNAVCRLKSAMPCTGWKR